MPSSPWSGYGQRGQTRRKHLTELQSVFGYQLFAAQHYQPSVQGQEDTAAQTYKLAQYQAYIKTELERKPNY